MNKFSFVTNMRYDSATDQVKIRVHKKNYNF